MFYPFDINPWLCRLRKLIPVLLFTLCFCVFDNSSDALSLKAFDVLGVADRLHHEAHENKSNELVLSEVAPPELVQKIRARLTKYSPKLKLESLQESAILKNGTIEKQGMLVYLEDWPLVEDPELGIGTHLVFQIDDFQPKRITHTDGPRFEIPLNGLTPGSHRIAVYLAYPWGEALKAPDTSFQARVNVLKELKGVQPANDSPWLTVVSPSENQFGEPLMLDCLIWNAPLQGLKDGDDRWRLRVTVNAESFLLDREEAIWLDGVTSKEILVQFELLDETAKLINPVFNNKLRLVSRSNNANSFWMKRSLSENEISILTGELTRSQLADMDNKNLDPGNDIDSPSQTNSETQSLVDSENSSSEYSESAKYDLIFP